MTDYLRLVLSTVIKTIIPASVRGYKSASQPFLAIFCGLLFFSLAARAQDATHFAPLQPPKKIKANIVTENIAVDGQLNEAAWQAAAETGNFFQVQPDQGLPVQFDTQVKVLYDARNLYLGIFCPDSLGKKGIRVPDLRRDFEFFTNDLFGVSFDPFRDKRNAISFMTNPYGAQRDLLAFDDNFFDREWDGLWRVRTTRTDSGWVAEMAFPWSTLRYPKDSTTWGINFVRIARRLNETSAWNPYPRSTNNQRMEYAGLLTGLQPPPPAFNVRVQPYILNDYQRQTKNGDFVADEIKPKVGGEIKWAIDPNTVLDITANTDFAQADADRQVNNLTRFSVFFPERRQFFLENANLFSVGQPEAIQPFFSRRIGLSASGLPLPVDGGVRLVSRSPKRGYGAIVMRQRETGDFPATYFGVARYSRNIGKQNRIGGLVTARLEDSKNERPATRNYTYSADAFFRPRQPLTLSFMASISQTTHQKPGLAFTSQIAYYDNQWSFTWNQSLVSKNYTPGVGFVYGSDIVQTNVESYRMLRPAWRPKGLRQLDPGFNLHLYHRASDQQLQQAEINLYPFYLVFVKGGLFYTFIIPTWQYLDAPFKPLGIPVRPGRYQYTRYQLYYGNDQSRKFSYRLRYAGGGFYDGRLQTWFGSVRFSPVPHISTALSYEQNQVKDLGELQESKTTHLITPEVRLAANPRLQLTGFYQKNTVTRQDSWNVRLAWEFKPLSFLYLVYNNNLQQTTDRLQNEQVISKITYLKQF